VALTLKLEYLPQLQDYILYGLVPVIVVYVVLSLLHDFRQRRQQAAG